MGWFDGRSSTHSSKGDGYYIRRRPSPTRSHSGHSSHHKHSGAGYSTYHSRNSAPSFFNLGRSTGRSSGRSSPAHSVFSSFSSSSRRARPREGFVQRIVRAIKRLFRDIYRYARHHPIKVLLMVIVPLLTSGVLPKLLAMVGLRLPHGVVTALGGTAGGARGPGGFGGPTGGGGGPGLSENLNSLMNIAKMFA